MGLSPTLAGNLWPYNQANLQFSVASGQTTLFTSDGTFTPAAYMTTASVFAINGGDSGVCEGNSSDGATPGAGGSGGCVAICTGVTLSDFDAKWTITVGAGGATATEAGTQNNGTYSSLYISSTVLLAFNIFGDDAVWTVGDYGGNTFGTMNDFDNESGAGSDGSAHKDGYPGVGNSIVGSGGGGGIGYSTAYGAAGVGGASGGPYGGTGGNGGATFNASGTAATDYGAGGGGNAASASGTPGNGGAGSSGIVGIITSVESPSSYNIYRNGTLVASTVNQTYSDPNLTPGTYQYEVVAVINDTETDASNIVTLIVGQPYNPESGVLFDYPIFEALDQAQLAGAELYFYETDTLTQQVVYADKALEVPLSQPVQADAAGRFPAVYLNPNTGDDYRVQLYDYEGSLLSDVDPYPVPWGATAVAALALATPIQEFSATTSGVVPGSGGGTSSYMRADGNWDQPPGTQTTPLFSSTASGLVPASTGDSTDFLNAAGNWEPPFSGGLTILAGSITYTGTGAKFVIPLTPAFPTACLAVKTSSSKGGYNAAVSAVSTTGFTLDTTYLEGTPCTIYWIAFGN